MYLIPSNNEKLISEKEKVKAYYATDIIDNGADFDQEISLWMKYWASQQKRINRLSKTLKYISNNNLEVMFPNIKKLMSILLTTSATSALVERANSALRFIKTDYRSTMPEDRFNAFALLYSHWDIKLDYNRIMQMYTNKYPLGLLLINPPLKS